MCTSSNALLARVLAEPVVGLDQTSWARLETVFRSRHDSAALEIFDAARVQAAAGGREEAIARFNRFLDGLHEG